MQKLVWHLFMNVMNIHPSSVDEVIHSVVYKRVLSVDLYKRDLYFQLFQLLLYSSDTSYVHCAFPAPRLPSSHPPLSALNCRTPPPFSITISVFTRRLCRTHPTYAHFEWKTPQHPGKQGTGTGWMNKGCISDRMMCSILE